MRSLMKKMLVMLLALMVLVTFAGCGGGAAENGNGAAEDRELTIFHYHVGVADQMEKIGNEFMAETGINIVTEMYASDHATVLMSKDAAGNLPDIFDTGAYEEETLKGYYESGKIQPVQDLDVFGLLDPDYVESLRSEDGNIYLVPRASQPIGVIYNENLFEQAGISSVPTTFSELMDAVDQLNAAGITPFGVGGADAWTLGTPIWTPAVEMFADSQTPAGLTSGDMSYGDLAEPVMDLFDLILENSNDRPLENDYANMSAMLATEQVAMILMGNWIMGDIIELNPELERMAGMFPIPVSENAEDNMIILNDTFFLVNAEADFDAVNQYFNFMYMEGRGKEILMEEMQEINAYGVEFDSHRVNEDAMDFIAAGQAKLNYVNINKPAGFWQYEGPILQDYVGGRISRAEVFEQMDNAWRDMAGTN